MAAMNPNPISTSLSNCCIDERWISGTYIVSGVFTIPFDRIGTTVLQDNLPALFSTLRGKQLRKIAQRDQWLLRDSNLCRQRFFVGRRAMGSEPTEISLCHVA